MQVKGNNGRAARRRKMFNVLGCLCAVFCALLAFLVLFEIMSVFLGNDGSSRNKWNRSPSTLGQRRDKWKQAFGDLRGSNKQDDEQVLQMILKGQLSLVDIVPNQDALSRNRQAKNMQEVDPDWDYTKLFKARFCKLDWSSHEKDPSLTPMFRDVIAASNCGTSDDNPGLSFDLKQAARAARDYDALNLQGESDNRQDNPHVLDLAGLVFHESRCGSTLIANLLQAHNPDENIVYSESGPPVTILRLADATEQSGSTDLSQAAAATVLQDVIYLMSRTNAPQKRRVFFKIQSIGTLSLPVMRRAFASTPWIFVYRDATEVLMSHIAQGGKRANCVQTQHRGSIPNRIKDVVQQHGGSNSNPRSLSTESYCAAHLATLTEMAATELELLTEDSSTHGMAVNYHELPSIVWEEILPSVFGIGDISDKSMERMEQASHSYSKGRGSKAHETFEGDSQKKQDTASSAVQRAAETFLEPSFKRLQSLAEKKVLGKEAAPA